MTENSASNNKRIAKNTLFLYIRLGFSMIVSLYTSRVILNALGVEDFGVYNVVGGVIALFAIVTSTLNTATSRFLTVELGRDNIPGMRAIYSNCNTLYLILGLFIILLEETIGLYLVNYVLVIPPDRVVASNVLYQTVVISSFITLINTPAGALIVSYEKMDVYAYIGVAETVAKLAVALILTFSSYDKIITLAVLNLIVAIGISGWRIGYCRRFMSQVFNFHLKFEKQIFRSMVGFSFWNLIGSAASVLRVQGVNILLNVFFGPVVNAANAIAYQVNSAVNGFVSNFTLAVNPQITKTYAAEEYQRMKSLIYYSGRVSFYLLMFLCLPIIFETNFILHLWLGKTVPEYAVIMTRLVLVIAMVETFTYSIGCAINATGEIRNYQLVICGIMLTIFPVTWLVFKLGALPYFGLVVYLATSITALISRFYFMDKLLNIHAKDYIKNVYKHTILVSFMSIIIPIIVYHLLPEGWSRFIIMLLVVELSNAICIWLFGLTPHDRQLVKQGIGKLLKNAKFTR